MLGRVIDIFGKDLDGGGEISFEAKKKFLEYHHLTMMLQLQEIS